MKRKLLAITLISAFTAPARAGDYKDFYIGISGGQTSSISQIDNTHTTPSSDNIPTFGMFMGYQFAPLLALEGSVFTLTDTLAKPGTPAGANTTRTIAMGDIAGVLTLPITDSFSFLMRLGYAGLANVEDTSTTTTANGVSTTTSTQTSSAWDGPSYGLGMEYLFNSASSGSRMQIGFRAGINKYDLRGPGGLTDTPRISYIAGLIKF